MNVGVPRPTHSVRLRYTAAMIGMIMNSTYST
jgi:hypothetical protein